jgi:hypothetical protein
VKNDEVNADGTEYVYEDTVATEVEAYPYE